MSQSYNSSQGSSYPNYSSTYPTSDYQSYQSQYTGTTPGYTQFSSQTFSSNDDAGNSFESPSNNQNYSSFYNLNEEKLETNQNYEDLLNNYNEKYPLRVSNPPQYNNQPNTNRSNNSQSTNIPQNSQQFNRASPTRPLQKFTIRDVLELPIERQEYLKNLPIQNLKLQPEYKVIINRPNVVLGIADYYQKIIPDKQFSKQVSSIKKGKQIKQVLWLSSIIGYLLLTGKMSRVPTPGYFKGRSHIAIPFILTGLIMFENGRAKVKTNQLIYDPKNQQSVNIALRKFICEANKVQKATIFGQS